MLYKILIKEKLYERYICTIKQTQWKQTVSQPKCHTLVKLPWIFYDNLCTRLNTTIKSHNKPWKNSSYERTILYKQVDKKKEYHEISLQITKKYGRVVNIT